MVELVADIPDAEAGALADLVVFETFVIFERNESTVVFGEFGNQSLEGRDGIELAEHLAGIRIMALKFAFVIDRRLALVIADVAEGEISHAAEKPCSRVYYLVPVGVQFQKRVLDEILSGFSLADEAMGIAEEWGFLCVEDLPKRGLILHGWFRMANGSQRYESGVSLKTGAGGDCVHESTGNESCDSRIKTRLVWFP